EKAKTKYVYGYMINEYSTALSLFESGKLDFQQTLPANELANLKDKSYFRSTPILGIYYYGFNIRKAPFDNEKVRRAFIHAVDRSQITTLLGGGLEPLSAWVPKGMFGYEADIGLKFDVA